MHNWSGSRARADAQTVACRHCHALAGEPCVADRDTGRPLEAFPAHDKRVRDAQKASST